MSILRKLFSCDKKWMRVEIHDLHVANEENLSVQRWKRKVCLRKTYDVCMCVLRAIRKTDKLQVLIKKIYEHQEH